VQVFNVQFLKNDKISSVCHMNQRKKDEKRKTKKKQIQMSN